MSLGRHIKMNKGAVAPASQRSGASREVLDLSDRLLLQDCLQWDIMTWSAAMRFWQPWASTVSSGSVLELGARDGGLSLYFALLGHRVVCSDLQGPTVQARTLHERYGISDRMEYATLDMTEMALPDSHFDMVCFKSVLGGVGYRGRYDRQQQALAQVYRILKPGGMLLFAENLQGTFLHHYFRRLCVKWARDWRYVSLAEIPDLFGQFRTVHTVCHGVLATFGRTEWQRSVLHRFDRILEPLLPDRCKYMIAGVAEK